MPDPRRIASAGIACALGLLLLLPGRRAVAADAAYLPQQAGRFTGWEFVAMPSSIAESRASAAEVKASDAAAQRLAAVIRAAPLLEQPKGFNYFLRAVLTGPDPLQAKARAPKKLPLDVWLRFGAPHYFEREGRPVANAPAPQIDFYINDLRPVILGHQAHGKWLIGAANDIDMFLEPRIVEEIGGYPLYEDDKLAITRAGEAIWSAVSVENFIQAWMPQLRGTAAEVLPAVRAQLAALDAAGRAAPTCLLGTEVPLHARVKIVPVGTPGCRRIVEPDTAILRSDLPRDAIQSIIVEGILECRRLLAQDRRERANPGGCNANLELIRQLDWRQVGALLRPDR